jgi:glutamyl-tRNA reductase
MLNVSIYNRSIDNAHQLAQTLNANSFHLSELENVEGKFDTIIICTSANQVVIDHELYIKMLKGDTNKKLIIDLAVPRNISEEAVEINNVDYIDISKLKEISEINLQYRKKELERATPIIHDQLENFREGLQRRQLERAFSSIPTEIKSIKQKAITEVYGQRIQNMDKESTALLMEMMDYMEKKCISVPLRAARETIL